MKRAIAGLAALAVLAAALIAIFGSSKGSSDPIYRIEMDNAFGLVTGADFKVAGVKAGKIESINLDQRTLHAVVTVSVTQPGLEFHPDVFCISRPQSLIGEYFITCEPGSQGPALKPGATIPVSRTESTIPADLLQDINRLPYRERLTLIIGELGAAATARSGDLEAALRRAVPALTQTDNLLNLLANDSQTLKALTTSSDHVITALADNSSLVQRFIVKANTLSTDTARQDVNLRGTFQRLPGFLAQLRPAMAQLGQAAQANEPVLANLNASAGTLDRFFVDLPPFARASRPAIRYLGQAAVTGRVAVKAATPTIRALNQFARSTPELAQNLAIVTQHLDNRRFAVEKNPRSPGGQGYTGLESLLQFVFNIAASTNTFGPFGHQLAVDAFVNQTCGPYANPQSVTANIKQSGLAAARSCYSFIGPNQPGVNETDPSNPTACVPDPGGAPPGEPGPKTSAPACSSSSQAPAIRRAARRRRAQRSGARTSATGAATTPATSPTGTPSGSAPSGSASVGGVTVPVPTTTASSGSSVPASVNSATKQLLSYLISP